ncbi:CMGC/SRPK protein kinase, partial [Colletotrichum asianum]
GVDERSGNFLEELAEAEFAYPSSRRIVTPEHTVCASTIMDPREGPLLLSSFSLARCGGRKLGTTEMLEICSPEVMLRTEWSFPIDIWSVGLLAWKLFGM